jgi:hypothetical protein
MGIASRDPLVLFTDVALKIALYIASSVASAVAAKIGDIDEFTKDSDSTGLLLFLGFLDFLLVEKAIT